MGAPRSKRHLDGGYAPRQRPQAEQNKIFYEIARGVNMKEKQAAAKRLCGISEE
jgi:hypothetical protein